MGDFTKRLTARRIQRTFTPPKGGAGSLRETKGTKDGKCNLTACQKPGAFFLHSGNEKYYCVECLVDIGGFALRAHPDPMDIFPTFDEDMKRFEEVYVAEKPSLHDTAQWAKDRYSTARALYERNQRNLK